MNYEDMLGQDIAPEILPGYDEVKVPIADVTDEPASNVDGNGVAHFCVIPPQGEDFCGGCQGPWPCPDAVRLMAVELPQRG